MRDLFASLTPRGRTFLAAGLTVVLCSFAVGQSSLMRIGLLLTVVPVVAMLFMNRARYHLTLVRELVPPVVTAGDQVEVRLGLSNAGRAPTGYLMLEDSLPFALGSRPRFVLESTARPWQRQVSYRVRSDVRGQFEVGPMSLRTGDPFGLVEIGRTFRTTSTLTVTPRWVPLPSVPLTARSSGSGDHRLRAFSHGNAEDVTVREYRQGDDLRRVHWRTSARVGDLMVRSEEHPWQSRALVLVDNRVTSHRGTGAGSSFETALSVAASVVKHLTDRGWTVRLAATQGVTLVSTDHGVGRTDPAPLMEAMALMHTSPGAPLDPKALTHWESGVLTVAVLGSTSADDHTYLRRLAQRSAPALAMVLDVDQWAGSGTGSGSDVSAVVANGWRAVEIGRTTALPSAWQWVARTARAGGA